MHCFPVFLPSRVTTGVQPSWLVLSSEENSEHALGSSNIYWKEDTSHVAISLQPPWWQVHSAPSQDGGSWFWFHPWASTPKHLLGQAIVPLMDRRGAAKMWITSHAVSGRFAFIFWKVAVSLQEVEEHGKRLSLLGLVEHVGLHWRSRKVRHVTCSQLAFLTWATSKVVCQEDISMAKNPDCGCPQESLKSWQDPGLPPAQENMWGSLSEERRMGGCFDFSYSEEKSWKLHWGYFVKILSEY